MPPVQSVVIPGRLMPSRAALTAAPSPLPVTGIVAPTPASNPGVGMNGNARAVALFFGRGTGAAVINWQLALTLGVGDDRVGFDGAAGGAGMYERPDLHLVLASGTATLGTAVGADLPEGAVLLKGDALPLTAQDRIADTLVVSDPTGGVGEPASLAEFIQHVYGGRGERSGISRWSPGGNGVALLGLSEVGPAARLILRTWPGANATQVGAGVILTQ